MGEWYNRPAELAHPNGTVLVAGTSGNTGGAAGGYYDGAAGTMTYIDGMWRGSNTAGGVAIQVVKTLDGETELRFRGRFYLDQAPSADLRLVGFWNGGKSSVRVEVRAADRRWVVYDDTGAKFTSPNTSPNIVPIGATFDIALSAQLAASSARIRAALYLANGGDTATPSGSTYDTATNNTGTAAWTDVRWLKVNSGPQAVVRIGDSRVLWADGTALLDPLPAVLPPVINLGPDATVEPGSTVQLVATHTAGGAPDDHTWDGSLGATPVTITETGLGTAEFTAPVTLAGTTVTVRCTPADGGTTGTPDTVTFTVPPHHGPWTVGAGGALSNPTRPFLVTLVDLGSFTLPVTLPINLT